MFTLPNEDLENIFSRLSADWPRGKTFLVTGGTGFFGRWIVESIAFIETKQSSGNQFIIVSRQESSALALKIPSLTMPFFTLLKQDLSQEFKLSAKVDYVLHAASDVTKIKNSEASDFSSMVAATLNLIRAVSFKAQGRLLYVSSGGVYKNSSAVSEDELTIMPANLIATYNEGKRQSELLIKDVDNHCIARCFAFVGPYADKNMAVMDMLIQKSKNLPITVNSPEVVRSFMYPTDLTVGLFKLLFKQTRFTEYNLGSDTPITLAELATKIASLSPASEVKINSDRKTSGLAGGSYYPNIARINGELGRVVTVDLDEALLKTINFITQRKSA